MIDLVLAADDWKALTAKLIGTPTEECAVLFTRQVTRSDGHVRLLVRVVEFPQRDDYTQQGPVNAQLTPVWVAWVTKRARQGGFGVVFVHSHPGTRPPEFSTIDDVGERHLADFLARRHPDRCHVAMVVSAGGVCARRLGAQEYLRVVSLGASLQVLADPAGPRRLTDETFDRQVRAFGPDGQAQLQRLRIGVVGLGGTGSVVVQQLAHLGVAEFLLIDPDVLEISNLNRVVGAQPSDVGQAKVDIAARMLHRINPAASIQTQQGDVIRAGVAIELRDVDVIFGCTDSHGSRAVLQQLAYQYLLPYFDVGTVIAVREGTITHISGQARLLAPGLACHTCAGLLDPEQVRRDMMTAFERQQDPYIVGATTPAPAVISINSTVASLAITMLLSVVTGLPGDARHLLYDGIKPSVRVLRAVPVANCFICSKDGALAEGDAWPLLARQD